MSHFAMAAEAFNVASLRRELEDLRCGAVVSFEGIVRNHSGGRSVSHLEYQSFAEMAVKEGQAIIQSALSRFAVHQIICLHRVGVLLIGETAVWVGVSAAHRSAAFDACRFVIDEVKMRVPIWKNEHYTDGSSGWIHPENTQ